MKQYLLELYEDNLKVAHSHHCLTGSFCLHCIFGLFNIFALRQKYTIKVLPAADIQNYP